ncbi:MAG: transcription elongation factor GreA [Bdellovibrionales bacterium]|jgi:transcription elongation factor GreA|nr:transcription elongation factor GreA [Bdellovibrionales bacterium]
MAANTADGSGQGSVLKTERLPITIKGKLKLEEELKRLLQVERPAVIRAIEEARAHGDISENAEYDAAKERQSLIEGRIGEIQGHLAGAEVVDPSQLSGDRVVFGAHVDVVDTETEEAATYQIVGVDEADVKEGRISILSPIARALIGKRVGDVVTVRSPKTDKEYEITGLQFK